MDEVYVVEIAATGPKGSPQDGVAEIAVCRMLADGSDFDTVYNDGVALDPLDLGKDSLDYMEGNYGILPEELYAGTPVGRAVADFQRAVFGRECTSYDMGNVFGKYLSFEPWDATRNLTLLPSISLRLPGALKGVPEQEHLLIRKAYEALCPGDPACVGDGRRALHLAQMAVSVLMVLRRRGLARSGAEADPQAADEQVPQREEVSERVDYEERQRDDERERRDQERQGHRDQEHQESAHQEERAPLVSSDVELTHPQEPEQAEDRVEDHGGLHRPGALLPPTVILRVGARCRLRLDRDLLVALGAGDAVGRHQLAAVGAASRHEVAP